MGEPKRPSRCGHRPSSASPSRCARVVNLAGPPERGAVSTGSPTSEIFEFYEAGRPEPARVSVIDRAARYLRCC